MVSLFLLTVSMLFVAYNLAACIFKGGAGVSECKDTAEEPFRVWCGLVGELQSLVSAPLLALTATASKFTRNAVIHSLGMTDRCYEIVKSPDRPNIFLSVQKIESSVENFDFLVTVVKKWQINCPRVVVYCQTQSTCSLLYTHFHYQLGDKGYWPEGERRVTTRLVEMFHSSTPEPNKDVILSSLRHEGGTVRVIFATNALGMGINVKGLSTVIHYGPPNTLEAYMQEIGRSGRDGKQSCAYLFYHGHQLMHCKPLMKKYVQNFTECRRAILLTVFDAEPEQHEAKHTCCDVCMATCECSIPQPCPGFLGALLQ